MDTGFTGMKFNRKTIVAAIFFIVVIAALFVFNFIKIDFTSDAEADKLIQSCIMRLLCSFFALGACCFYGIKHIINPLKANGVRSVLWCLPCLMVALANFPYTALLSKSAAVDRTDLIWLFAVDCLLIGVYEEFLFRGLFQRIYGDLFTDKKNRDILTLLATSATFALWHLFNLFSGASVGATLLQVGYSFLIGAMLSAVVMRTENIWICVLLHALFDFGGLIVPTLGHGQFQDVWFWLLTAVCGVLCAAHIILYIVRRQKNSSGDNSNG